MAHRRAPSFRRGAIAHRTAAGGVADCETGSLQTVAHRGGLTVGQQATIGPQPAAHLHEEVLCPELRRTLRRKGIVIDQLHRVASQLADRGAGIAPKKGEGDPSVAGLAARQRFGDQGEPPGGHRAGQCLQGGVDHPAIQLQGGDAQRPVRRVRADRAGGRITVVGESEPDIQQGDLPPVAQAAWKLRGVHEFLLRLAQGTVTTVIVLPVDGVPEGRGAIGSGSGLIDHGGRCLHPTIRQPCGG